MASVHCHWDDHPWSDQVRQSIEIIRRRANQCSPFLAVHLVHHEYIVELGTKVTDGCVEGSEEDHFDSVCREMSGVVLIDREVNEREEIRLFQSRDRMTKVKRNKHVLRSIWIESKRDNSLFHLHSSNNDHSSLDVIRAKNKTPGNVHSMAITIQYHQIISSSLIRLAILLSRSVCRSTNDAARE